MQFIYFPAFLPMMSLILYPSTANLFFYCFLVYTIMFGFFYVGASYGLLNSTTFDPTPSYFTAMYGKRLLSTGVLGIQVQAQATYNGEDYSESLLRSYAFCSQNRIGNKLMPSGSVVVILLNTSPDKTLRTKLAVDGDIYYGRRTDYRFTADSSDITDITRMYGSLGSSRMRLNGELLQVR